MLAPFILKNNAINSNFKSLDGLELNEQFIFGSCVCWLMVFCFLGELLVIKGNFLHFKGLDRYFGQFGNIDGIAPFFNFRILYTAC